MDIVLPSGRKLSQYAGCTPEAVSGGSPAQMMFFVRDAKADIAFLAELAKNAALSGAVA